MFSLCPVHWHGGGEVHDLHYSQPPGGDRGDLVSLFWPLSCRPLFYFRPRATFNLNTCSCLVSTSWCFNTIWPISIWIVFSPPGYFLLPELVCRKQLLLVRTGSMRRQREKRLFKNHDCEKTRFWKHPRGAAQFYVNPASCTWDEVRGNMDEWGWRRKSKMCKTRGSQLDPTSQLLCDEACWFSHVNTG